MLLVPRQLQRSGMTGTVPYYGGRFTPAQAYAASHPQGQAGTSASTQRSEALRALQFLLDTGVLTANEYRDLRARVGT